MHSQAGNLVKPLKWLEGQQYKFLPSKLIRDNDLPLIKAHEKLRNHLNQRQTGLILECSLNQLCADEVDLSFYGNREILEIKDSGIPDFAQSLGALLDNESLRNFLIDQYFTEFDHHSNELQLAGIFQTLDKTSTVINAYAIITELLIKSRAYPDFKYQEHQPLRDFLSVTGLPSQIGIMCGRGQTIKVIGQTTQAKAAEDFLEKYFSKVVKHSSGVITRLANQNIHPEGIQPLSYSLDYDIEQQAFLPRLSIEIFPSVWPRACHCNALPVLDWLCKLSPDQRVIIEQFCAGLPIGACESYPSWMVETGIFEQEEITYLALPSHLKLSFQRGHTSVKGYFYAISDLTPNQHQ
ncbi:hypothetical protein MITS9509_03109 [Synechococcus sp. MIT S9509]|uniref:hypothetical protein n=1 Tax=unclassified Synechococcus TaxID=2626047 RepID=UPI0007BBA931|nr:MULTISPECIES: hypothetical protein [unclassified Synechococcus]KZR83993.1 hypothetical protein MITS9504_03166 [Synechococcus sp. MIT S9504]KZR89040.1 hypothetical protein MITS9509_03109 [Synechococcus sp. MIT S9509]